MNPAIKASIDYWREVAQKFPEIAPTHVSHYIVKENGELRCYAVKWNGANLGDHVIVIPPDAEGIIEEAKATMTPEEQIGQTMKLGDKTVTISCWIHSGPIRNVDWWVVSFAGSMIEQDMPAPIVYATKWIAENRTEL